MNELYNLKKEDLLKKLNSSDDGLNSREIPGRLEKSGINSLRLKNQDSAFLLLVSQVKSPLMLVLIFASILAGFLGDFTESFIIIGIIIISAVLSFYQEFKSEKTLLKLENLIVFNAKVFRNGEIEIVNTEDIVPGDIVVLNSGDMVPADIYLFDSKNLSVDESSVTGESYPVEKTDYETALKNNSVRKKAHILFMGTSVLHGSARGIVVQTGKNTEFGKTAILLSAKEPPTDFQKSINKFGNFLVKIIVILTIFIFGVNAFLGKGVFDSILFALAIAVGITPELLPAIITIALSFGAIHMAEKKVIVKKLASIEDLGNMNILCMDKTGTLTENEISVKDFFDADGKKDKRIIDFSLLCNAITANKETAENGLDMAIVNYAKNSSIKNYKIIDEIEFSNSRKRMSVVVEKNKERIMITKGAPEELIDLCEYVETSNNARGISAFRKKLLGKFESLSGEGYIVLSVAYKKIAPKKNYSEKDERGLTFLGFVVFSNPPKKTARDSIEELKNLGISLFVLTGDNEIITKRVCQELDLEIKNKIILGAELENLSDKSFVKIVNENNVFARVNPEQKFKIVQALKNENNVVGFLGDGINDAATLKLADVGISVDSAVDLAKDSASIIILQKSLRVIADGVIEGRKTFGNVIKYILNTTSANFGNMITLSISSLFLKFVPLLPSQILLTNLISDVPLTTISTDAVDSEYLKRPNRWDIKFISKFMIVFGAMSVVFDLATMAFLFLFLNADANLFRTGWFLESVISEIMITFSIRTRRSFWKSKPSKMLAYTSLISCALTLAIIFSPLRTFFHFEKLNFYILGVLAVILLGYFMLVELSKKKFYEKNNL